MVIWMPDTSMNIRTDSTIKKQAEMIFAEFGLNMTTAVNMFLRQTIREQGIPFNLTLKKSSFEDIRNNKMEQRIARLEQIDKAIVLAKDEEMLYIPRSKVTEQALTCLAVMEKERYPEKNG